MIEQQGGRLGGIYLPHADARSHDARAVDRARRKHHAPDTFDGGRLEARLDGSDLAGDPDDGDEPAGQLLRARRGTGEGDERERDEVAPEDASTGGLNAAALDCLSLVQ